MKYGKPVDPMKRYCYAERAKQPGIRVELTMNMFYCVKAYHAQSTFVLVAGMRLRKY